MSITPESLEETWEKIRAKMSSADGSLVLEQAITQGEVGLSAIVRVRDSLPGLVIRVPRQWNLSRWQVQQLNGVHFEFAARDDGNILLPVMLANSDSISIFSRFATDLSSTVSSGFPPEEKMRRLLDKISLWRRFFTKRTTRLSEEEIRGLFGELQILENLIPLLGVDAALEAWKGPRGELHDFHLGAFRIEVKTWTNKSLPKIFISDPSQIVIDPIWPLWISAVQLSSDMVNGLSLPEKVVGLFSLMNQDQKITCNALLADAGYLGSVEDAYTMRYSVIDTVFYLVTEGFPMIDPATIPVGISNVKYALDLNALSRFINHSPV